MHWVVGSVGSSVRLVRRIGDSPIQQFFGVVGSLLRLIRWIGDPPIQQSFGVVGSLVRLIRWMRSSDPTILRGRWVVGLVGWCIGDPPIQRSFGVVGSLVRLVRLDLGSTDPAILWFG